MSSRPAPNRLVLPQVTLCAASSINVAATMRALETSLAQADFGGCKLFTDKQVAPNLLIDVVRIAPLTSAQAYSDFVLSQMVDHVATSHCLILQWDGHLRDAAQWRPEFLDYDYIGASWPHFGDGHDVGNGGFSLRSRRLMLACRSAGFDPAQLEDIAICRENRVWLESRGMRFAPRALADAFSAERSGDPLDCFGYHGVWHMPRVLGVDTFWHIYRELDDRSSIRHDFGAILAQISRGPHGWRRAVRFIADQLGDGIVPRGKLRTAKNKSASFWHKDERV